jgi:hypothetical protein
MRNPRPSQPNFVRGVSVGIKRESAGAWEFLLHGLRRLVLWRLSMISTKWCLHRGEFSDADVSDPSRPVPTAKDIARGGISANSGNPFCEKRAASCTHGGQIMLSSQNHRTRSSQACNRPISPHRLRLGLSWIGNLMTSPARGCAVQGMLLA